MFLGEKTQDYLTVAFWITILDYLNFPEIPNQEDQGKFVRSKI